MSRQLTNKFSEGGESKWHVASLSWTEPEIELLKSLLSKGLELDEIASRLNRTYLGTAHKAAAVLTLGERGGKPLKVPRGKGLSKREVSKLWGSVKGWSKTWAGFCRRHKIDAVLAASAMDLYFPDEWPAEAARLGLEKASCPGCAAFFYRAKVKGRATCSNRCTGRIRRDSEYFDGMRMEAVGMAEGVCQVCMVKPKRGLSAHHVLGKGNDPDNKLMVALCVGCHQLVTDLSLRGFLFDSAAWVRLIKLVLMRKYVNLEDFNKNASFSIDVSWSPLSLLEYCEGEGIDPEDFKSVTEVVK
jgi:hypothetical protein